MQRGEGLVASALSPYKPVAIHEPWSTIPDVEDIPRVAEGSGEFCTVTVQASSQPLRKVCLRLFEKVTTTMAQEKRIPNLGYLALLRDPKLSAC